MSALNPAHSLPDAADARRRLAADTHRPRYHFLPPSGWINDPNGLIEWGGEVHLFYQHNPYGPWHERIHWGHAASSDLLHWRDLPIALTPTAGEYDEGGCFSGCAVDDHGVPTLFYTGVWPQVVNRAVSHDGLLTWVKDARNPQIPGPPPPFAQGRDECFRDPYVWRAGNEWVMVIGSQREDRGGTVLLYRSGDGRIWDFAGPLLQGDVTSAARPWGGTMWECPNLLQFDDRTALIFSPQSAASELLEPVWHTGVLSENTFDSQQQGVLVYGHSFYAPQVLRTPAGRKLMWGWLKETRPLDESKAAGWNGALSLPMDMTLDDGGAVVLSPATELQQLRQTHHHAAAIELTPTPHFLAGVRSDAIEMVLEFEADGDAEVGVLVHAAPDGSEQTVIWLDGPGRELRIDRDRSRVGAEPYGEPVVAPYAPAPVTRLHVFVDGSVIELFADGGRTVVAARTYPAQETSRGVALVARRGRAHVTSLDLWEMASVW